MIRFKSQYLLINEIKLDEYLKYWADIDKLIFKPEVTKDDFELRNVTHQLTAYQTNRGTFLIYGLATYLSAQKSGVEKARVKIIETVDAQDVASLILRDLFDNAFRRVLANDDIYKTMLAETFRHGWASSVGKDAMRLMDSLATTKEKAADTLTVYRRATIFESSQDKDKKQNRKKSGDFKLAARWLGFDSGNIEVTFDTSGRIKLAEHVENNLPQLLNWRTLYGRKYEAFEDTSFKIRKSAFRALEAGSYYVFELGELLVCAKIPDSFEKGFASVFEMDSRSEISETSVTLCKERGMLTAFIKNEEFRFVKENNRCVASSDSFAKTKSKLYKHVIMPVVG